MPSPTASLPHSSPPRLFEQTLVKGNVAAIWTSMHHPMIESADCSLRQGAGPLKAPTKPNLLRIFLILLLNVFGMFGNFLNLLVSKSCFLSSSTQNHAELCRNFVTNSILNHLFFTQHIFLKIRRS